MRESRRRAHSASAVRVADAGTLEASWLWVCAVFLQPVWARRWGCGRWRRVHRSARRCPRASSACAHVLAPCVGHIGTPLSGTPRTRFSRPRAPVGEIAVVTLGPDMISGFGLNKLRPHPQRIRWSKPPTKSNRASAVGRAARRSLPGSPSIAPSLPTVGFRSKTTGRQVLRHRQVQFCASSPLPTSPLRAARAAARAPTSRTRATVC